MFLIRVISLTVNTSNRNDSFPRGNYSLVFYGRTHALLPGRYDYQLPVRSSLLPQQQTAVVKMADAYGEEASTLDSGEAGEQISAILRRCRGRPRLTDTDRAKRRLESRKKYDVRRVYLGESHKVWSELRRRTSLSDAGLAEYLILLHSTYGERYPQKYSGKRPTAELSIKQKNEKIEEVCSLRGLVQWYQEHARSCPHEPQLRALEPPLGIVASAVWRCPAGHSFLQRLCSPAAGASESESEAEAEESGRTPAQTRGVRTRARRKRRAAAAAASCQFTDAGEESEEAGLRDVAVTLNHVGQATVPKQLPGPVSRTDTPSAELSMGEPSIWEMEVVMEGDKGLEQESENEGSCRGVAMENDNMTEDEKGGGDALGGCGVRGGGAAEGPEGYECVVVTAAMADRLENGDAGVLRNHVANGNHQPHPPQAPPTVQVTGQGDLFEPQTLQTVVASCQIPDGRGALEGSQVIIITGPGYEALASEGIQLNMGGGGGDEVTCTFIEGVAYNQVCQPEAALKVAAPDSGAMRDLGNKQLLQPSVGPLRAEAPPERESQRALGRSRRSRRGPVVEADGMLKMFHCPYEGCSQVYVAISSFQNHVNLVHRKGRTKVCPHPGCGKKFYLSNHLHRHMIIHSGVRDFICETCGKSFKRKNHLEVHRRTHTGETPLQCEICGYQCRQRASLNWHMKKHTTEAQYNFTCEHCGKRFEKLDSVKFHKLKSHPDKQAT
ncbi:zinc finger protein 653 isoform X2 [Anguilla anguilla]|uniref:zinc finger protein 653 isoform X2 n=1 Tax=Anguilla anguilla TaxID=7936 RepID=UPI0015A9D768|nr:zinc finger protein 653 isoform X2 [Anguilla anguilla]